MDELTLFIEILEIDDPDLRRARIDEVVGDDANLRTRIEELLEAHLRASKFMETSAHLGGESITSHASRDVRREQPGDVIGPYKLLQVIGEGGMGSVFMAEQTKPVQRRVALKIIKAGMDSKKIIARFEAERQALAMMDHPNIAKVLDAGTTGAGHPYFVMELVKGVEITTYCDQKRLGLKERLELFIPVCQAIQHAHQKGIIHRDIKPSNVLVAQYDGTPVPKVIDFGVAKATAQKLTEKTLFTEFGQVMGTVEYMSPEQAELNQLDIDTRSDVYSLGVLLYELLTGSTPLDGKKLRSVAYIEMLRMIREQEPSKPSTKLSTNASLASIASSRSVEPERLGKMVKGELDWIVMKALEKDRSRRYASSSMLAEDVGRYLNNEQILACPASLGYRLRKMTWKNRAALATVALVMVGLAVGLGVATWQAIRAMKAEQLADSRFQSESTARAAADKATSNAENAAKMEHAARDQAEQLATASRISLARSHVAAGTKYLAEKKYAFALSWFVEALRVNESNKQPTKIDRLRIGMVLQQCPKPIACFQSSSMQNKRYVSALFDPRGIAIGFKYSNAKENSLQVYEILSGKPISTVLAASGRIEQATLSPDGRFLAAKSDDQVLWLWEILSSRMILSRPYEGTLERIVFSSNGDRVAFLKDPGNAQILNTSDGQELATFALDSQFRFPNFSPDGTKLLWINSRDEPRLHLWDAESGVRSQPAAVHSRFLTDLRFSHDGNRIVTASFDSTAIVWDVKTLAPLTPPLKHDDGVETAIFSNDDSSIITASLDGSAKFWNSTTGALLTAPLNHDAKVWIAASSHDGSLLVTGGDDATARVWNPDWGKLAYPVICHHERLEGATFDKSGRTLMTATGSGFIQLWDLATTYPSSVVIDTYPSGPMIAAFTGDSRKLFVGGVAPRLWTVDSGAAASPIMDHGANADDVVVAANGRRFATFEYRGGVKIWDRESFTAVTPLLVLSGAIRGDYRSGVSFSREAKNILCLWHSPKSRVGMWDALTGTQLNLPVTKEEDVTRIAYSPDGRIIASTSTNKATRPPSGFLSLWDGTTGELIRPRINLNQPIKALQFSPDSHRLATNTQGGASGTLGEIRIWDIATGENVGPGLRSDLAFYDVEFNQDGTQFATASFDQSIRVWNVATGVPITPPFLQSEAVIHVSFSPDGKALLASCGSSNMPANVDASIRLLDATTGQPISPPLHHPNPSMAIETSRFSSDGHYVASSGRDRTTCIWALEDCLLSTEWLEKLAEILSGKRLDETGGFSPLNTDELQARRDEMAAVKTDWFMASPQQTIAWNYHRASELTRLKKSEEAIDCFDQLVKSVPSEMVGLHNRRFEAALATHRWDLAREDLAAISHTLGEGHTESLYAAESLANHLFRNGLVSDAASLMDKWLYLALANKDLLMQPHRALLMNITDTAESSYSSNGEQDKANSVMKEAEILIRALVKEARSARSGEGNPPVNLAGLDLNFAGLLAQLGNNLIAQKEWSASESILRECLAIRDSTEPEVWTTSNSKFLLGISLLGQKKFDEAEPMLAAGWEGVISRKSQIPTDAKPAFLRRIERLIALYRALDKPEAADVWTLKLNEF